MQIRSVLLAAAIPLALGACRPSAGQTNSSAPDDFVTGSRAVRIGMTEAEVVRALAVAPETRQERERVVELGFRLAGRHAGFAAARFVGGPLVFIEFSLMPFDSPPLPRISQGAAKSLAEGPLAIRAIQNQLAMSEVLAATGMPGRRVSWKLYRTANAGKVATGSGTRWLWEVDPGGKALIVDETDGVPGQPIVRDLPRPPGNGQPTRPGAR